MSSVDDRIVNMQFNNKQFTQGASDAQKSLQNLDQTVAKMGSGGAIDKMGSSVEGVTGKFGAMRIAGISAIATIASKATAAGINLVKSMTLDPLMQGFQEYEKNLNSTQTIMANTGKSVKIVGVYLDDLNRYSDQTIYNFGQMADSIGKFTAAGVPLKDAVSSIKGLANAAALSGSDVNQLNTAMYQMSQALSTGVIRLMDWNSLANAGMGGKNIRESLMATNRTLKDHGAAMDAAIAKQGSFRDSLQEGWLTADTFNKTMKVMAGQTIMNNQDLKALGMTQAEFEKSGKQMGQTVAFTVDQLKKMGYTDEAAKKLHKLSAAAIDSATKVKTFSQMIDVVKESIGSGFAMIFRDVFGDFEQAKTLWTNVTNSITGAVGRVFSAVDQVLVGWRKLGGFTDLWTGIGNIFKTLGNLIHPFVVAFQTLLPATGQAGAGLAAFTHGFAEVTGWMERATSKLDVFTPAIVAVFSIFRTGFSVIGAVVRGLEPLVQLFGILGNELSGLGGLFNGLFGQGSGIGSSLIQGILSGLNPDAIQAAVTNFANSIVDFIKGALGIASPASTMIPIGLAIVQGIVKGILVAIPFIFTAIGKIGAALINEFQTLFSGVDALGFASLFNALLTGGILLTLRSISGMIKNFTGIGASMRGTFDQLTDTLKTMQTGIRVKIIEDIAIAVALLAASIWLLSTIDEKNLAKGLGAVSLLLAEITIVMSKMAGVTGANGEKSKARFVAMAASLAILSTALLVMSAAVKVLGSMSLGDLAKGMTALSIGLGLMVGTVYAFSKIGPMTEGAAGAIFVMASAMVVLSAAVLAFGNMSWDTLGKGLGAVGIALMFFVGALQALSANVKPGAIEGAAGSILIMATAMVVLSTAVLAFGNMSWDTLTKGFGAVALALMLFVGSLEALGAGGPASMAGAAAIGILALALSALVPLILVLGSTPWGVITKGIGAMAIVMALFIVSLAAMGAIASVVGPALLVLGAALLMIGVGMAALGAGIALLATFGTAGLAVMSAAIAAFIALLPSIAQQVAAAFVAFLQVIANATPQIGAAMTKIIQNILKVLRDNIPGIVAVMVLFIGKIIEGATKLIPKFGRLISQLITTGLQIITKAIPQYVTAGLKIIGGILDGLSKNMPKIIDKGTDVIVKFIEGIGDAMVRIADAMGRTILKVLRGLDAAIVQYTPQIAEEGRKIIGHLIQGMIQGLTGADIGNLLGGIKSLGGKIVGGLGNALGLGSPSKITREQGRMLVRGLALGILDGVGEALNAIITLTSKIISEGDKAVAKASRNASRAQFKASQAQARADILADEARAKAAYARQHKKDKAAQKAAKAAQKQANQAQKTADASQKDADRAASRVESAKTWAGASTQEKGDIKDAQALALAERSQKLLAKANAEAARARELMKTNHQAGQALLAQARKDAAEAAKLEKRARKSHAEAQKYYAKDVRERIKALDDQAAYDAADDAGKRAIMEERAKADDARAKRLRADAKRFLDQAKKLAKSDPKAAQRLLDKAEAAAQAAEEAAQKAEDERQQAGSSSSGSSGTNASITPSKSVLEDAAKAVNRYTASLQQAEEAAGATQTVVQFVQNNTSPEALTASEIYRQSKNLLSTVESKW